MRGIGADRAGLFDHAGLHEAVADEQHEQNAPARLLEEDGAGQEVKRGNKMLFSVWMCSITSSVSLRAPT
jgi:hypothetical protein